MAEARLRTGKSDNSRIYVDQTHEINYWTKQLKTSPEKLKKAVGAVGPMVKDIKKWLGSN